MSEYLLVKLKPTTPAGHDAAIQTIMRLVPIAEHVTDMEAISRGTLDAMLLPQAETWEVVKRRVRRKSVEVQ